MRWYLQDVITVCGKTDRNDFNVYIHGNIIFPFVHLQWVTVKLSGIFNNWHGCGKVSLMVFAVQPKHNSNLYFKLFSFMLPSH